MILFKKRFRTCNLSKALLSVLTLLFFAGIVVGCSTPKGLKNQRTAKEAFEEALENQIAERLETAEASYKSLMESFPLSTFAVKAQLKLADLYYSREEYDSAAAYYTNFVAIHPSHSDASYALFQKGMSLFQTVLSADRDQTPTRKALFALEDLKANYKDSPYHKKADELIKFLRRRLADREIYIADFYFKNKKYRGALARYRDILDFYPDVGLAPVTLFSIAESYRKLDENTLARQTYETLLREYASSSYALKARKALKSLAPDK